MQVSAFNQTKILSFGFGKSNSESLFKEHHFVPKQKETALDFEETASKRNSRLVLSEAALTVLGENGEHRFDEFKSYREGWYGGKGGKLKPGSVFFLNRFTLFFPQLKFHKPSLFMTLEGNLSIGFEDKEGNSVEIEFFSDRAEYYLESSEEENFTKLANIFELIDKLRNLLK